MPKREHPGGQGIVNRRTALKSLAALPLVGGVVAADFRNQVIYTPRSDALTSAPISTGIYQPKDVRILKAAISRYVEHASEIKSPDSYRLTGACELDEATNSLIIVVDAFPAVLYEDGCVGREKIFTEADIAAAARRVIRIDQFTGERPIRQFVQATSDATEAMTLEMLAFAVAGDVKYGEQLREIKRKLDARPAD